MGVPIILKLKGFLLLLGVSFIFVHFLEGANNSVNKVDGMTLQTPSERSRCPTEIDRNLRLFFSPGEKRL